MKTDGATILEDVTRVDFGKTLVINAQNLCVAVVINPSCKAQLPFQIKGPTNDALSVLAHQRALAG